MEIIAAMVFAWGGFVHTAGSAIVYIFITTSFDVQFDQGIIIFLLLAV